MNPKLLVNIDRLAFPVYWITNLLIPLFKLAGKIKEDEISKVAVIKLLGIGSITRIFTALKKENIDLTRIEFFTLESNKELCEILRIPNVHYINVTGVLMFLRSSWSAIGYIRKQKVRSIIDYERSSNLLAIFRALSTAFSKTESVSFYNLRSDRKSGIDYQFRLKGRSIQELITITIPFLPKSDHVYEEYTSFVQNTISEHSILVNINASDYMSYRKYSRARYAKVITSLLDQDKSLNVFLVGSPDEKEYVDTMIEEHLTDYEQITNCCGLWNLKQLITALDTCRLLITNDSGPMHLSVMRGVQTLAIWGPTTPDTFGYDEYDHVVNIQSGRTCAPCFTNPKSKAAQACNGRIDCMKDIQPNEIVEAASKLLSQHQVTA